MIYEKNPVWPHLIPLILFETTETETNNQPETEGSNDEVSIISHAHWIQNRIKGDKFTSTASIKM